MGDNDLHQEDTRDSSDRVVSYISSSGKAVGAVRRAHHRGLILAFFAIICALTLTACARSRNYSSPPVINAAPQSAVNRPDIASTSIPDLGAIATSTGLPDSTPTGSPETGVIAPAPTATGVSSLEPTITPTIFSPYASLLTPVSTSTAYLEPPPAPPAGGSHTPTQTPFPFGSGPMASPLPTQAATVTPTPTAGPGLPGGGPVIVPILTPTATSAITPTAIPQPGGDGAPIVPGQPPTAIATPAQTATMTPTPDQFDGGSVPPAPPPVITATPTPVATLSPTPTIVPEDGFDPVVDLRILPDKVEVAPGDSFSLAIVVEPNSQEVSAVQVVLRFNPDYLQATSARLNPDSPLRTKLVPDDFFDNAGGNITLSAGPYKFLEEAPTTTFTLGSLTFIARQQVEATTEVGFVKVGNPNAVAGLEGVYITGDLFSSIIEIGMIPTPTPTETPTLTPTPTP